ncbi:MAG: hypothetical protein IPI07_17020 [Flavobacteriales bacterium]|nr:hypothetical protein [Flavobacteriales bacterium]
MTYLRALAQRSVLLGLLALPLGLCAQPPFLHRVEHPTWPSLCRLLRITPLNTDQCRLAIETNVNGEACVGLATLAADGTLSDMSYVPMGGVYGTPVVNTTDGGHLFVREGIDTNTRQTTLLKTDADGEVEWMRFFPDQYGRFLTDDDRTWVEKDGGYYGIGHRQDVPVTDGYSSYLMHVDGSGNFLEAWNYAEGDGWSDLGRAVIRTHANGLTAVSVMRPYSSQSSFPYIAIQRWNASMDLEWSNWYTLGNYHSVHSTTQTADGGIVIAGSVRLSFNGDFRSLLMKVDTAGQVAWARLGTAQHPVAVRVLEGQDGRLWMAGNTDYLGLTGTAFVAELTSDGQLVNANALTGTAQEFKALDLERDPATGALLVGGYFYAASVANLAVARVDTLLQMSCTPQPFAWTDSLVVPNIVGAGITLLPDVVSDTTMTGTAQVATFSATIECLSTAVPSPSTSSPTTWIVPGPGALHIASPAASAMPYSWTIVDVAGRTLATGRATANTQALNTGFQGTGVHLLLIDRADGTRHVERFCR